MTASGTLKAYNALASTATIPTQAGTQLVLNITAQSKVLVNGAALSAAALLTKVGSQVNVEYHAETTAVTTLDVKGQRKAIARWRRPGVNRAFLSKGA